MELVDLRPDVGSPKPVTQKFGTALSFHTSPGEALRLARIESKLVFLLHVSGNFEDAGFT